MKEKTTPKNKYWLNLAVIALVLIGLMAVGLVMLGQTAEAAPPAAPTPISNVLTSNEARYVSFQPATALAADTNTGSKIVEDFNSVDIQYVIDQGTTNTNTLTIQWSVDGSNWVNGPALVTNNAADASDIVRVPVFGRYARINQNLTNTNTITITLVAIARD